MLNKTLHPGADIGGNNDLRLDRIVCRNLCLQGMLKRLFARFAEKLKNLILRLKYGVDDGTRTRDLLGHNQTL